jgi:hypothetical protein
MKSLHNFLLILFLISLSHITLAGRWLNWDVIATDISDGVTAVVDYFNGDFPHKQTKIVGNSVVSTQNIPFASIDTINISGTGTLIVTHNNDQEEQLIIETEEALMPYIDAHVIDNQLMIKIKDNTSHDITNLIYRVNSKTVISNVTVSGAVYIELQYSNTTPTQSLTYNVFGASQLHAYHINTNNVHVHAAGASKIVLLGSAKEQHIDISGTVKCDGSKLGGEAVTVNAAGATTVYCNTSNALSGTLMGTSTLYYAQKPKVTVSRLGISSVKRVKE